MSAWRMFLAAIVVSERGVEIKRQGLRHQFTYFQERRLRLWSAVRCYVAIMSYERGTILIARWIIYIFWLSMLTRCLASESPLGFYD